MSTGNKIKIIRYLSICYKIANCHKKNTQIKQVINYYTHTGKRYFKLLHYLQLGSQLCNTQYTPITFSFLLSADCCWSLSIVAF